MNPPQKPDDSDCCNAGCTPCIFDIYEQQLKLYEKYFKSDNFHEHFANCLSLTTYSYFKLINVKKLNLNNFAYIFQYVENNSKMATSIKTKYKLFYKPGQHFLLKNVNISENFQEQNVYGTPCTRAYTPIPFDTGDLNSFMVLIKIYQDGKMSQFIKNLQIGELTKWRGPYGNFEIKLTYKNLFCLSQGTGIAPIYSVIHELLNCEECETRMQLFACYKNLDESLLRKEIHEMKSYWNFSAKLFLPYETEAKNVFYNEKIECRRIIEDDVDNYFNSKFVDPIRTQVLICGSDIFVETVKKLLQNYIEKVNLFVF